MASFGMAYVMPELWVISTWISSACRVFHVLANGRFYLDGIVWHSRLALCYDTSFSSASSLCLIASGFSPDDEMKVYVIVLKHLDWEASLL